MAWEHRERGGSYYTRSRREDGRIVREYVGVGVLGEIAALEDEYERRRQEEEAAYWKEELERLEELAAPVLGLSEAAEILVRAHLIAAGYHRHKGEWRRARVRRCGKAWTQPRTASPLGGGGGPRSRAQGGHGEGGGRIQG